MRKNEGPWILYVCAIQVRSLLHATGIQMELNRTRPVLMVVHCSMLDYSKHQEYKISFLNKCIHAICRNGPIFLRAGNKAFKWAELLNMKICCENKHKHLHIAFKFCDLFSFLIDRRSTIRNLRNRLFVPLTIYTEFIFLFAKVRADRSLCVWDRCMEQSKRSKLQIRNPGHCTCVCVCYIRTPYDDILFTFCRPIAKNAHLMQ